MRLDYVLKRLGIFFLIVWVAATLNFFLPRLGSRSPIEDKLYCSAVLPQCGFRLQPMPVLNP